MKNLDQDIFELIQKEKERQVCGIETDFRFLNRTFSINVPAY